MTLQEIVKLARPEQQFWRKSGRTLAMISKEADMLVDQRFYPKLHLPLILGVQDILADDWELCDQVES